MYEVKLHVKCMNTLGEGILWNEEEQSLYWSDIDEKKLYRWNSGAGETEVKPLPDKLASFAFRKEGGFLFAFASSFAYGSWDSDELQWIESIHPEGSPVRLNDGRCDRQGRFIVGDFDPDNLKRGNTYRVDTDGTVSTLFEGISCANSTCFSPEGNTMYFTDTPEGVITSYNYNTEKGIPQNPRTFVSLAEQPGNPDGSIVDAEGCLWNAQWGGSRIVRYTPEGNIDRVIEMPVKNITCMCFGGKELSTLYVTTARAGLSEKELETLPLAGCVFSIHTDVHGLNESRFGT